MELFQAKDEYILQSGDRALWCSRKDGTMTVKPGTYVRYWMPALPAGAEPAIYLNVTVKPHENIAFRDPSRAGKRYFPRNAAVRG